MLAATIGPCDFAFAYSFSSSIEQMSPIAKILGFARVWNDALTRTRCVSGETKDGGRNEVFGALPNATKRKSAVARRVSRVSETF